MSRFAQSRNRSISSQEDKPAAARVIHQPAMQAASQKFSSTPAIEAHDNGMREYEQLFTVTMQLQFILLRAQMAREAQRESNEVCSSLATAVS
jgi:hypothetical protein